MLPIIGLDLFYSLNLGISGLDAKVNHIQCQNDASGKKYTKDFPNLTKD